MIFKSFYSQESKIEIKNLQKCACLKNAIAKIRGTFLSAIALVYFSGIMQLNSFLKYLYNSLYYFSKNS